MSTTERRQENKFIVYTDIVGHTKMLGRLGMAFKPMRERHDELFRLAVRSHDENAVVKGSGDGFYAASDDVDAAIEIALAFRRALAHEDWDRFLPEGKKTPDNHIRSRVGIHSGLVRVTIENGVGVDFDGNPRNVAEKVMSKAQGNQVLVSRQVRDQGSLNFRRNNEVEWKKYGEFKLREVTDTVEIWGLGEAEFAAGPPPTQDPEHRVIIFAVVHDYSVIVEQAGPQFEALKDRWDATLLKAVEAHSKDTFIKRLPEGTIAAFRNAMEAVRAARDFRRMWKAEMRTAIHRLEPKTTLDSGLVTFSYENNRASDVRDQPVNMAAKVAKTGLTAPWQLILTRPVREDAFANMPERDEFGWVCVGRKAVSGEPEPVELWDFQDVQVKREDRTILWVDLAHIREDLKSRRDVYIKFIARLDQMLGEALARRGEEAWTLAPDAARIAAFRDPVEGVQAAMDLRSHALSENWGDLFKNRGKGWHPLKIGLHSGPVRMTSEDGQRKDIKGAPVDGVKLLADACKMGQVVVSRELKEAVSRHLPDSEVRWAKIDVPAKDDTAVEGFELLARQRGLWDGLSPVQRYAAMAAASVLVLGLGVGGAIMASGGGKSGVGGGGNGGGGVSAAGRNRAEASNEFNAVVKNLAPIDDLAVRKLRQSLISAMRNVFDAEKDTLSPAATALQGEVVAKITDFGPKGVYDAAAAAADLTDKLTAIDVTAGPQPLADWLKELDSYKRLDRDVAKIDDPRVNVANYVRTLRSRLSGAGFADNKLMSDIEQAGRIGPEIAGLPWIGKHQKAIEEEAGKALARVGPGREFELEVNKLTANARDPVPADVAESIRAAAKRLRDVADVVEEIVRKRARELDGAGQNSDQVAAALEPMRQALTKLSAEYSSYDGDLFRKEQLDAIKKADFDGALRLLGEGAAPYRLMARQYDQVVGSKWPRLIQGAENDFKALASPAPELAAKKRAAEEAVAQFPPESALPWITRNEKDIEGRIAKVDALIGDYANSVSAALAASTKTGPVAPAKAKEYGALPAELSGVLSKLSGGGAAAKVGETARQSIEGLWRAAEGQRLPRELAESDLRSVTAKLIQLEKAKSSLDEAALLKELPALGAPGTEASTIDRWLGRVLGYVKIEGVDPRVEAGKRLDELAARFIGDGAEKIPPSEAPKEFADARRALARIPVSELPWIEVNRNEIKEPAERLAATLAPAGTVEKALEEAIKVRSSLAAIDQLRQGLDGVLRASPVLENDEPILFEEWQRFRTRAMVIRSSSDSKAITAASADAKSLSEFLAGLSTELKRPAVDTDRAWTSSVATALNAQRSAALRAAVEGRGKPEAAAARQAYGEAMARAGGFIKRWKAIEDAFRAGGQLGEPVVGFEDKRLGDVIAEALADPLLSEDKGDRAVRDALSRLVYRAGLLRKIALLDRARGGAFTDLIRVADDAQAGFETRVAVWNSMEYLAFADDREWLTYHKRVFTAVETDLERLGDKVRVDLFKSVLARDKPRRWFMHVARLSTFDQIDSAITERGAFGVSDDLIAKADPEVRWNIRVHKIDSARRLGASGEQKAREAIGELRADATLLEALKSSGPAQAFLRGLADTGAGGGGGGGGSLAANQIGPGSVDWELVEAESRPGQTLVYQMKAGNFVLGRAPKLTFAALTVGGETVYLATTELSVRVAFEQLQRTSVSPVFIGPFAGTQREGPFTWDYDANKPTPANLMIGFGLDKDRGKGTWARLGLATAQEYFGPNPPPAPEADMPLQYVSLSSALFLARQFGCRLPTPAEFDAAIKVDGGPGDLSRRNLRDQSYKRQAELVKACMGKTAGFSEPDKDVFALTRAGNQTFRPADDGVTFFAPVDADPVGRTFKHLIGNVAEAVCENARGMEGVDRQLPSAQAFVSGQGLTQFAIAGESALSEVRENAPAGEPRKLPSSAMRIATTRGWSDVGMRLAFTPSAFKAPTAVEVDFITKVKQVFDAGPPYLQGTATARSGGAGGPG